MLVSAWRPDQLDEMVLPPCHYSFQFYTRELTIEERYDYWFKNNYESGIEYNINNLPDFDNEYYSPTPTRGISLMWNQRSVDTPLGLPFNITSYALLLEIIGRIVNMIPDELIGNLGDCHIYSNQIDGVKEQISRKPYDMLPTLKINDEFWNYKSGECGIGELNDDFNSLIKTINVNDFSIENYKSHSKIKIPLSN
jgi:thymidylate synthase